MQGLGIWLWEEPSEYAGKKYVGEFKDNQYQGKGTFTFENGNKYIGQFSNMEMHGIGKYIWVDKSGFAKTIYEGEFKHNQVTGYGIKKRADGTTMEGYWENGNLTRSTGSPLKFGFNSLPKDFRLQIQTKLAGLRLYNSTIDGLYGPNTANALTTFNRTYCGSIQCSSLKNEDEVTQLFVKLLRPKAAANQKKDFTLLDALGAFAMGVNSYNQGSSGTAQPSVTQRQPSLGRACFGRGDYVSGFNKICNYDCLGSAYAMTISSTSLCPLTVYK